MRITRSWSTAQCLRAETAGRAQRQTALYLWTRCAQKPLVTPTAEVHYELEVRQYGGLEAESVVVPASKIIHDRMNCHCPIRCSVGADSFMVLPQVRLRIIEDQNSFANHAHPGGMLWRRSISQDTAERLKTHWNENSAGNNAGKIAALETV